MTRSGSRSSGVHQARQAVHGLLKQGVTVPALPRLLSPGPLPGPSSGHAAGRGRELED